MSIPSFRPCLLLLADDTVYYGKAAGKIGTTTGEICFNTGQTGYQEVFTDPSYYKQILVTTHVHIGNYGVHVAETESNTVQIAGLVCKDFGSVYSRKTADCSLKAYFERQEVVGISGIDTRSLVRHIQNKGAMNAIISSETTDIQALKKRLADAANMSGLELSSQVSTKQAYFYGKKAAPYKKVALLDLGVKQNILRCFDQRNVYLKVFPAKTKFQEMEAFQPDGYFVSNGPGDPSVMHYAVQTVAAILQTGKPYFGICLGHQLLAQAMGVPTYKMHHGHRGLNHPVKNLITGRCEITSQNHGFAVNAEKLKQNQALEITHLNLNDHTIEGMRIKNKKVFSVQYHPESSPGTHDSRYLFDDFVDSLAPFV